MYAYYGDLWEVSIPNGVISIESMAFEGCNWISGVTMPDSVKHIGAYAFSGCEALSYVKFSEQIRDVGEGAFLGCELLADKAGFVEYKGVLFGYYGDKTEVVISNGITRIDPSAFSGCFKVTNISIPDSVESIGSSAFEGCTKLKKMILPNSVTSLGSRAFSGCSELECVEMSNSIKSVGSSVFAGCYSLHTLTIPQCLCNSNLEGVIANSGIRKLILADGVTSVQYNMFYGCENLMELVLPNSVTEIDNNAFQGFYNLRKITVPQVMVENTDYNYRFYFGNSRETITDITIADGARVVGEEAFERFDLYNLTTITIPASVEEIGRYAFYPWFSNIKSVIFKGNAPNNVSTPLGLYSSCTVYVPRGSSGWGVTIPGLWNGCAIRYADCSVTFNPNGGEVEEKNRMIFYNSEVGILPEPAQRWGYNFKGWFTASSGGQKVSELTTVVNDTVFYAQWEKIVVPKPVIVSDQGNVFYGRSVIVTVSSSDKTAVLYVSTNGITPRIEEHLRYTRPFEISTTTTVKAIAVVDGIKSECETLSIVKKEMDLSNALGASELTFDTDNEAPWVPMEDADTSNGFCVVSGVINSAGNIGQFSETWIETTVNGAGIFSFKWRVDCEKDETGDASWDHLSVFTNNVEAMRIDGLTEWKDVKFFFGSGSHTVRWVYKKDYYDEEWSDCTDCGWLCDVNWTSISTPQNPIPEISVEEETEMVKIVMEEMSDVLLPKNIKTVAEYSAFRNWAIDILGDDLQKVKASPNAWLSYALDAAGLIAVAPKEGDLKIDSFESSSTDGAFEFTVKLKDIAVGYGALEDNLKKVFDIEGREKLSSGEFSSNAVQINAAQVDNGNVKFTVTPKVEKDEKPTSFFFKAKMK